MKLLVGLALTEFPGDVHYDHGMKLLSLFLDTAVKTWSCFFLFVGLLLLRSAIFSSDSPEFVKRLSAICGSAFALVAAAIFVLSLYLEA